MVEVLGVLLGFALVALVALIVRSPEPDVAASLETEDEAPTGKPFTRKHPVAPWVASIAVALGLHFGLGIYLIVAAAVGIVAGVGVNLFFRALAARKTSRLEFQLADAMDLMVSSLRAGAGLTDAIESATRESRRPLRGYLNQLLNRIRLGERPEYVLANLERLVPVESFRLFTMTLAAHWEGGGSLATTLSNVGRTIRDRVDVKRRVRSQAVETQASVVGVLVVTYGLALLMWNNYPDRFETFATSELGSMFIGLTILLQAVGVFWISKMTTIEV